MELDMESFDNQGLPTAVKSPEELIEEFKSVLQQGQELLDATKHLSGEALTLARDRFQFKWDEAKIKLNDVQAYAIDRSHQARELTANYVHDHPWWAISVATGVGVLLGASLGKRSSKDVYTRH
jgi:ElaB/YqjD/DUF883 family membrane-anchored ribosome-binding protein